MNMSRNTVESREILQVMSQQIQYIKHTPQMGEISPKQQEKEKRPQTTPKTCKISPKQPHEERKIEAMEEGAVTNAPNRDIREGQDQTQCIPRKEYNIESGGNPQQELSHQSPQGESAQQFLNNNFSDVMRSSAIRSNVSSLFNATAFTTTHNE